MTGSDRLKILAESQTLAITKEVRQLRAKGQDIVGLTLGEPDFDTPQHIRAAAQQAIEEGFTHYTPVSGIPELRRAVADKYKNNFGIDCGPENVVISTGAKQSLVNTIMSLVNPGEEVILHAPFWVSYYEMLKLANARTVVVETKFSNHFKMTPEQLEAAITPKTRMLILNNPKNPTGTMYSRAELEALAEVIARHPGIFVISDEIYEHITYDEKPTCLATISSIADRVIVINGVSKGFAMTGWRIGYVLAPKWIAELCDKFQGQITSGTSSISQRAAVAALTGPMEPTWAMRDEFRRRRDWLAGALAEIPGLETFLPQGAFYFYPDLSAFFGRKTPGGQGIEDIDQLCKYLLYEANIALIPGTAFGTKDHARISYAYSTETLAAAVDRLQSGLAALK